jgi:RHS repeat-associated protein
VFYYHYDGLGSVAAMSYSSGSLVEKYTYDVYGRPTLRTPSGVPKTTSYCDNRYMFTGREYDPCVGLYYYRARYYNPTIGRFLQTDPIRYISGLNLYTYVKNSPLRFRDPSGLVFECDYCLGLSLLGPFAYDAHVARQKANEVSYRNAMTFGWPTVPNGKLDAIRHCVWNCEMIKMGIPDAYAKIAGGIHELCHKDSPAGLEMDLYNNFMGRWLGSMGFNCEDGCMEALETGDLVTLNP